VCNAGSKPLRPKLRRKNDTHLDGVQQDVSFGDVKAPRFTRFTSAAYVSFGL
jgi:hypothetical protein